jgi:hypothetical protein
MRALERFEPDAFLPESAQNAPTTYIIGRGLMIALAGIVRVPMNRSFIPGLRNADRKFVI